MTKRIEIRHDHDMKWMRLCWRDREGGPWGKGSYFKMTEGYAQKLVDYMNKEIPQTEHWTELQD
jgi:hypothetical protein